jgi:hypothetical protein
MKRLHGTRWLAVVAALVLLPSVVVAEVSVQLDARGHYKRFFYLTAGNGRNRIVWSQVRPRLPQQVVLNPLGDNLGDLPPAIRVSPVTGYPWVVWPKNFGNLKQLVFSTWNGTRWTEPRPIVPGTPLVWDDLGPALAIDPFGTPYLVWWRAEQTAKVYFSTLVSGAWTPALLISDERVDSRAPAITLNGTTALISYRTPSGTVTKSYETAVLIDSAASLMDNPIPPLNAPPTSPSGGETGGTDGFIKRK